MSLPSSDTWCIFGLVALWKKEGYILIRPIICSVFLRSLMLVRKIGSNMPN